MLAVNEMTLGAPQATETAPPMKQKAPPDWAGQLQL